MHIHILGIAGVMTAPLAVALKKLGYLITGSDQEKIYPPFSDLISNIPLNQPLKDVDLAIIGSAFKNNSRTLSEFEQIKDLNIPYISATEYLAQNLIKKNSILVAGSYGKTTITALLAHIMPNINYFFGGQTADKRPSLQFSGSDWSVVEADESINGLDTQAKFLYYPVKYLVLTSVDWEHKDSYSSSGDNLTAYLNLIKNVPKDGLIVYNGHDPEINKIIGQSLAKTIDYQSSQIFQTNLIGLYNQQNIAAAYTLCQQIGIDDIIIKKAISSFPGLKRRLELSGQKDNIIIFDDFAQSAARVKSALEALKSAYPQHHLKIYFEPHASFLQNKNSLREFSGIIPLVNEFILGKISFSTKLPAGQRVTSKDWQNIFTDKFHYLPTNDSVIDYYAANLHPGDLLVHFSSGGLDGLNNLKTVYNHIKL